MTRSSSLAEVSSRRLQMEEFPRPAVSLKQGMSRLNDMDSYSYPAYFQTIAPAITQQLTGS